MKNFPVEACADLILRREESRGQLEKLKEDLRNNPEGLVHDFTVGMSDLVIGLCLHLGDPVHHPSDSRSVSEEIVRILEAKFADDSSN